MYGKGFLKRQNMLSVVSKFFGKLLVMGGSTHGRPASGIVWADLPGCVSRETVRSHLTASRVASLVLLLGMRVIKYQFSFCSFQIVLLQ